MNFDSLLEKELRKALDPIVQRPVPARRWAAKPIRFGGGGEVVTSGVLAPVAAMAPVVAIAPEVPTSEI